MSRRRLRKDPVSYRIEYSRLAQSLHADAKPEDSRPTLELELDPEVVAAIEVAKRTVAALEKKSKMRSEKQADLALKLVEKTMRELRRLGWKWAGGKPPWYVRWARVRNSPEDRRLGEFLDRVLEPAAVVLYWSCKVKQDGWPKGSPLEQSMPKKRRIRRRRLLLWDWRRLPQHGYWIQNRDKWLEDYLAILRAGDPPRPFFVLRFFAWLGFTRLRPAPAPNYRVRYSLACLLSRIAEREEDCLEEALDQLALSLATVKGVRREAILQWARCDPGLAELRRNVKARARFEEITRLDEKPPGDRKPL